MQVSQIVHDVMAGTSGWYTNSSSTMHRRKYPTTVKSSLYLVGAEKGPFGHKLLPFLLRSAILEDFSPT